MAKATADNRKYNNSNNENEDKDDKNKQQQQQQEGGCHDNDDVTKKAAAGTVATLALRLVSFGCTQWTLHAVDLATLGRANIQLELLLTTVLFVSREGFRLSLTQNLSNDSWKVAWLSVPLATILSLLALVWHLHVVSRSSSTHDPHNNNNNGVADYRLAGILYCLSSCIEGWAEPAILHALRKMQVPVKASAEGIATVGKTVSSVVILHFLRSDWPVTAFGIAQLVYAILYAGFLYWKTWSDLEWPAPITSWTDWTLISGSEERQTCYMTLIFTLQGFFKHLLTEGDRIVLTTLAGSYDQGVYAMGSAYGGMAARIILQPLEENARLLWSRLSAATPPSSEIMTTSATGKDQKKQKKNADPLYESYVVLVKLVLYIGFTFGCLAVNYTVVLLNVLAGHKWGNNSEATSVLSAFCVYTAFLAWNGMSEAFVYGVVSSTADIGRLGVVHTTVAAVFALLAPAAIKNRGTVGLVQANCLAMFVRAMYSVYFAARYFRERGQRQEEEKKSTLSVWTSLIQEMFPHPGVLFAFASSYFTTRSSQERLMEQIKGVLQTQESVQTSVWLRLGLDHVGVGLASFIGVATVAFFLERSFQHSLRSLWRGR